MIGRARRVALLTACALVVGLGVATASDAHAHWTLGRCQRYYDRWFFGHPHLQGAHSRTSELRLLQRKHGCPYGGMETLPSPATRPAPTMPTVAPTPTTTPLPVPVTRPVSTPLTVANLCNRNPGLGEVHEVLVNGVWWAIWLTAEQRPAYLLISVHGQYWELGVVMNQQAEIGWIAGCGEADWTTRLQLEQEIQAERVQQQQTGSATGGGCAESTVCSVWITQQFFDATAGVLGSCDGCVDTGVVHDPAGDAGSTIGDSSDPPIGDYSAPGD